MAYIDYEYYLSLYGEQAIGEPYFERLLWDAEREINKATSGIDGAKKLQVAFPTDEYDAEVVKRCICSLVDLLSQIEKANKNMFESGGIIASKSSGNESISFSNNESIVSTALKSVKDRENVIYQFIKDKLSGIHDANGVNLLFAGQYPYKVEV